MQVFIETPDMELSRSRHARLSRIVRLLVGRFVKGAQCVFVRVVEEPAKAEDRCTLCQVTIALPRIKVIARHRAPGMRRALFAAVDKARRSLARYSRRRAGLRPGVPAVQP